MKARFSLVQNNISFPSLKGVDEDNYYYFTFTTIIKHVGRPESPPASMQKQIRAPLTMPYSINERMWFKNNEELDPEIDNFIMQRDNNLPL